jgi:hypothetical protein
MHETDMRHVYKRPIVWHFDRSHFQVQWSGWQDANGNSTTWEYLRHESHPDEIEEWEEEVARRRKHLARQDLEIPIPDCAIPLHEYSTYEAVHALKEKLKRSKKDIHIRYSNWDTLSDASANGSHTHDRPRQAISNLDDVAIVAFHESRLSPLQTRVSNVIYPLLVIH